MMSAIGSSIEATLAASAVTAAATGYILRLSLRPTGGAFVGPMLSPDQFEKSQSYLFVSPKNARYRGVVEEFQAIRQSSTDLEKSIQETLGAMKLPRPGEVQSLETLNSNLIRISIDVTKIVMQTYGHGVFDLIRNEAQKRVSHQVPVQLGVRSAPLNPLEQETVKILEEVGVIDLAVAGSEAIAEGTSELTLELANTVADVVALPGFVSGVRTLYREFSLLNEGKTDFPDAVGNVAKSAVMVGGPLGFGLMIDAACGGATLGIPTICGALAGLFMDKARLRAEIESSQKQIGDLQSKIQGRRNEAVEAINRSAAKHFSRFVGEVKTCPDFFDESHMRAYARTLVGTFAKDMRSASNSVEGNYRSLAKAITPRNMWQRLFGVIPQTTVTQEYRSAANELQRKLGACVQKAHDLLEQGETSEVIRYIHGRPIFRDGQAGKLMVSAPVEVLEKAAARYKESIDRWREKCEGQWTAATNEVTRTAHSEHGSVQRLIEQFTPIIALCRSRIRANLARLGK